MYNANDERVEEFKSTYSHLNSEEQLNIAIKMMDEFVDILSNVVDEIPYHDELEEYRYRMELDPDHIVPYISAYVKLMESKNV